MPLRDTVRKELVDLTRLEELIADDGGGRDILDVSKGMFLFERDMSGGFDLGEAERSPTLASLRMRQILRLLRRDGGSCNVSSSGTDSKRTKDSQSQNPDSCLERMKPVSMSHSQGMFLPSTCVLQN